MAPDESVEEIEGGDEAKGLNLARVLKLELQDVREIVLVYSPTRVARKVTERSSVQDQIVSILGVTAFYPRE